MTTKLTLTLDTNTAAWLANEAMQAGQTPVAYVEQLLREKADPDQIEAELMDRLLAEATQHFPAVMTLAEKEECKDELLAYLDQRVAQT